MRYSEGRRSNFNKKTGVASPSFLTYTLFDKIGCSPQEADVKGILLTGDILFHTVLHCSIYFCTVSIVLYMFSFLWFFHIVYNNRFSKMFSPKPYFIQMILPKPPFQTRTDISSWLLAISFWRSTRWDTPKAVGATLKKETGVASPSFLTSTLFDNK